MTWRLEQRESGGSGDGETGRFGVRGIGRLGDGGIRAANFLVW